MPKYQKSHNETFLVCLLTGIPPIPYNDNGDEILCQYLTGDRQKITFWRAMEYNEYNYPVKKTYYNGNVDNIKYYIDYIYR